MKLGIARHLLRLRRADARLALARNAVCADCPHRRESLGGLVHRCGVCGCFLPVKMALAAEKCPLGKW